MARTDDAPQAPLSFRPFAAPEGAAARPRLLALLQGALARRLTLLVADSGYGKTTLLAQWGATLAGVPQAWHAARSGDAQPRAFERRLTAMLAGLAPLHRVPRTLDDALDALDTDALVVLDDLHLLPEAAQSLVGRLAEHALLHLVVAGRTAPAIPLARLRLRGDVRDLTAADLAFTPQEIAALGLDGDAADLWERTRGWPAAVGLARLAGGARGGRSPGELFDLLAEEVWAGVAGADREVLAVAAMAGALDGESAGTLAGSTRAPAVLGEFAARGWFTETPSGFECHALFGEFVVRRIAPDARHALARRIVEWRAGRGEWIEAGAASALCDVETRVAFLARHGSAVARDGGAAALRQALSDLPHDPAEPARLTTLRGRLDLEEGRFAAALDWFVRGQARAEREGDWRTLAHAAASQADALAQRGQYGEAARACRRALTRIGGRDRDAEAELWSILPWSLFHLGEVDEAFATLDRAQAYFEAKGDAQLEALCLRRRGAFHSMRGDLAQALRYETRALARFQQIRNPLGEASTRQNLGATLAHAGRLAEGTAQTQAALAVAERHGLAGIARQIRAQLAELRAWSGLEVPPGVPSAESEREAFLWHLTAARAARRGGHAERAWQAIGAARALLDGANGIARLRLDAEEAALLLEQGEVDRARAMLEPVADALWAGPLRIEGYLPRLHRAFARLARGDRDGARADLEALLAWRTQADLAAVFGRERRWFEPLLAFAREAGLDPGFAGSLLRHLSPGPARGPAAALRVEILGPLRVLRDRRAIEDTFERPQVKALLGYLALHHPRPVPASELVEALWPAAASIEESALYTTASRLRRALGRDAVVRDSAGYGLAGAVEVDRTGFDAALSAAPPRWDEAVEVYRGDVLADLPHAEWCFLARETYRNRFLDAAVRAGEAHLGRSDHAAARRAFEKALGEDPCFEPAVQGLMRALTLSGNASGARRAFRSFSARLERDLGLRPSEETVRLAERMVG